MSLAIFHPHFVIRIFPSAFYHPHFPIRIFPSAFYHPHFSIRHPPSAIRHPPPSGRHFTETRTTPLILHENCTTFSAIYPPKTHKRIKGYLLYGKNRTSKGSLAMFNSSPGQTESQIVASSGKLNLRRDLRWVAKRTGKFPHRNTQVAKKNISRPADISCISLANNTSLNLC